ncbi:MAG: hypothetical protein RJB11_2115 [Planctomycetota bacterium]
MNTHQRLALCCPNPFFLPALELGFISVYQRSKAVSTLLSQPLFSQPWNQRSSAFISGQKKDFSKTTLSEIRGLLASGLLSTFADQIGYLGGNNWELES